ncbi:MAG: PEP/pyruvate-binding domain-containing protein [Myxococcota bacterium]
MKVAGNRRSCAGLGPVAAVLWVLAVACTESPASSDADTTADSDATSFSVCDPADPHPLGPACSTSVQTAAEFDALAKAPTGVKYWSRATKYMVPALDDAALVPPLVQNAFRYPMHMEFLTSLVFPGLSQSAYMAMVTQRATRKYYAGNLVRIDDPTVGTLYGFTAYTSGGLAGALEPVEVRHIRDALQTVFTAGPLAFTFEPYDAAGPKKAKSWIDPGVPVYFAEHDDVKVEVYTAGTAYGRVRRYSLDAFEKADAAGMLTYRDLAVVDSVPFDVVNIVAGLVTAGRQWELTHVNVRLARRGTPNLFVDAALDALAPWDGQLVRLDARKKTGDEKADVYTVTPATEAEAEAWWTEHRPKLNHVPVIDKTYAGLDALTAMDTANLLVPLVTRFGGKATNLAKLYAFLAAEHQVPGFGIPFAPFEAFLDANTVLDARQSPSEVVTLRKYVQRLATDPKMAADPAYRKSVLAGLRAAIEAGQVPAPLVQQLVQRITQVFGGANVRVRFRSSSNVEDGLQFSGAGLYDSQTVCAADSVGSGVGGASACDPTQGKRDIARGLRKVWASLYNDKAWQERDWYQVPQDQVGMAILVSLGFPDEVANGVAFTGDPSDATETRYLVNAQVGDESVVSNDASKVPEKDLLELTDGKVTAIVRARSSSLAEPGVPVLTDAQLTLLGEQMAAIAKAYPLDLEGHHPADILFDLEFKVQAGTGLLKFKQIRPFLRVVP